MNFTKNDIHQIESKGLTVEQVKSQIEIFKTGVPYVNLSREATIDFGILKISDKDKARHIKKFKNCQIGIGGQNCHEGDDYGPYTGSINSHMLKNIGAQFVIIGHSENRAEGETDKVINLKIKSALKSKLKVIFC